MFHMNSTTQRFIFDSHICIMSPSDLNMLILDMWGKLSKRILLS